MKNKTTGIKAFEQFLQSIILITASFIFLYAIISKKAYLYVHARHTPVIAFASFIFFITGILQLYNYFNKQKINTSNKNSMLYLAVFIFPIAASIFLPYKTLKVDSLSSFAFNNGLSFQNEQSETPFNFKPGNLLELKDGCVVMDGDSFGRWLPELYLNLDSWIGKDIIIEGAVWKNSEILTDNEFAIGRMMMVCCASDMQPAGVIASWENAVWLEEDDWVRIKGVISKMEYEGENEPFIIVKNAEKIERPQLEYVYPF